MGGLLSYRLVEKGAMLVNYFGTLAPLTGVKKCKKHILTGVIC